MGKSFFCKERKGRGVFFTPVPCSQELAQAGRHLWSSLPSDPLRAGPSSALDCLGICEATDKLPHLLMSCEIPNDTRNEEVSIMSDSDFTHLGKTPCSYTRFLKNFLFPFLEWIGVTRF